MSSQSAQHYAWILVGAIISRELEFVLFSDTWSGLSEDILCHMSFLACKSPKQTITTTHK